MMVERPFIVSLKVIRFFLNNMFLTDANFCLLHQINSMFTLRDKQISKNKVAIFSIALLPTVGQEWNL